MTASLALGFVLLSILIFITTNDQITDTERLSSPPGSHMSSLLPQTRVSWVWRMRSSSFSRLALP
jgi:hypothetical protein